MELSLSKGLASLQELKLPYSKSISNRLLIMQALASKPFVIHNLSDSDDSRVMTEALSSDFEFKNLRMAGTALRFLTSYYAIQDGTVRLGGDKRLMERPISDLVTCLQSMGAAIEYIDKEGFAPLEIRGQRILGAAVEIDAASSSQFISSLLLIAPYLEGGLRLKLLGKQVSRPYIEMTISLMRNFSIFIEENENEIYVHPGSYDTEQELRVEADWSAAAFIYQYFSCSDLDECFIPELSLSSIQGDKECAELYRHLGVQSHENERGILLTKVAFESKSKSFNLLDCPDLIPSFALASSILLPEVEITGIQTLRHKESNRVLALKEELEKVGIELCELGENKMKLKRKNKWPAKATFNSHNDHRIAMCLSLLADHLNEVYIKDAEVVDKSFSNFYNEIAKLGLHSRTKN